MKKVTSLLLISLFCCFSVMAQSVNSTPEATIKGFYYWYVKQISKNKFPLSEQPAQMKTFITARCYNENKKAYEKKEFDADYFIAAQDFDERWATNIKISNVKIVGNKATANVLLDGKGDFDNKLKLKLVKEKGSWKIDMIVNQ